MKGLLRNNFYGAMKSAGIFLFAVAAVGLALLIVGDPVLLQLVVIISAAAASFVSISGFRKDASSKWSQYELTAPVRRKDIVKAQYISHAAWVSGGIILSAVFVVLAVLLRGNVYFFNVLRDPAALFCVSAGAALWTGTLFYPVTYALGADKNEVVMICSLLGAIGITYGIMWMVSAAYGFKQLSDSEFYTCIFIYVMTAIAFFLFSCFVSTSIYSKKDY